jgi:hypothetical protein
MQTTKESGLDFVTNSLSIDRHVMRLFIYSTSVGKKKWWGGQTFMPYMMKALHRVGQLSSQLIDRLTTP